ncbi:hypothetical protein [Mycobacteroides salmoniphilum]|uniref:hypothetical protein n=1 Tax=Mycobacteroides salmoniphilum TaxID=404941 RepID=UPI001066D5D3|nr:hypothetical protein [Mycobacteroides salmoniphilum]TDZ91145.1 hypothetical protein CCUG62472_04404 [Mycobacteroides salmoniphilum]
MNADEQPLGECPPVAWWQVHNIPYAEYVQMISQAADFTVNAVLDTLSFLLFGKTWTELHDAVSVPLPRELL